MLKALKAWLQRRRDRRVVESLFSKHISRKVLDAAAKECGPFFDGGRMPYQSRSIEFAFISVFATDAATYSDQCASVSELASKHDGIVNTLLPVVAVGFGCLTDDNTPGACLRFVEEASASIPNSVAIVHGAAMAELGSFGNSERLVWSFWWPGMLDALRLLAALKPGEVREIS